MKNIHYLFALLIEMADFAQHKIDTNLVKMRPSFEDLHPNTKFVDNKIIHLLKNNRRLNAYLNQSKLSWRNHPGSASDFQSRSPSNPLALLARIFTTGSLKR